MERGYHRPLDASPGVLAAFRPWSEVWTCGGAGEVQWLCKHRGYTPALSIPGDVAATASCSRRWRGGTAAGRASVLPRPASPSRLSSAPCKSGHCAPHPASDSTPSHPYLSLHLGGAVSELRFPWAEEGEQADRPPVVRAQGPGPEALPILPPPTLGLQGSSHKSPAGSHARTWA